MKLFSWLSRRRPRDPVARCNLEILALADCWRKPPEVNVMAQVEVGGDAASNALVSIVVLHVYCGTCLKVLRIFAPIAASKLIPMLDHAAAAVIEAAASKAVVVTADDDLPPLDIGPFSIALGAQP